MSNSESIQTISKQCRQILNGQGRQIRKQWQLQCKNDTVGIKNQRKRNSIVLSAYLLQKYRILEKKSLLSYIIQHNKNQKKKVYNYLLTLEYYRQKDGQCELILKWINIQNNQFDSEIDLYLKVRSIILPSILNKKNKQELIGVSCTLQQWFGIISKIFSQVNTKVLLDKFSEVVRKHYLDIKKDQNSNMNGSQILILCLKLSNDFPESFGIKSKKSIGNNSQIHTQKTQTLINEAIMNQIHKQDKIVVKTLANENKQVQQNLQQRQDKMIQIITQQVNDLRMNLQTERDKIRQLADRQKYFISTIKKLKGQFINLAQSMQNKRVEDKNMNNIIQILQQFELGVQKKESKQMKNLRQRSQQLRLIRKITEEQISHLFV